MAKKTQWLILIKTLKSGRISKKEFNQLKSVLAHDALDADEQALTQEMILDHDLNHANTAGFYRDSYRQFCNLISSHTTCIEQEDWDSTEIVSKYLYRTLTNIPNYNESEAKWRTFSITYPFECGLVRLFVRLCGRDEGSFVSETEIDSFVKSEFSNWIETNKITDKDAENIFEEIAQRAQRSEVDTSRLLSSIENEDAEANWITGIVLGYLAYRLDTQPNGKSDWHDDMTQEYYRFVPQNLFKHFHFNSKDLSEDLKRFVFFALKSQYEFALERLQMGQIAKFLTLPDDIGNGFQMQESNIYIQEGLLGLFGSTIDLWRSSGLLKVDSNGNLTPNKPQWLK